MRYDLNHRDARLSAVFLSPFAHLEMTPSWGKVFAAVVAIYQFIRTDAFSGALLLVVLIGMIDYWLGIKAARAQKTYNSVIAHNGAMGKICGVILLFLVRLLEGYIHAQGLGDTHGAAATAIAVSLFAVDLQSIAHHREEFGASRIPVLSAALAWLEKFAESKIPDPPDPAVPARRAEDPKP